MSERKKEQVMKKLVSAVLVVICLVFSTPALAENRDVTAKTQVLITLSNYFEGDQADFFAKVSYMNNVNINWPIVFGYAGPVQTSGKWSVYTLAVVMDNPVGWSAGPSVWVEYKGKYYLFVEGDYYFSTLAASSDKDVAGPINSYYGYGEASRKLNEKWKVGAAWEIFGNVEQTQPGELAYGLFVESGKIRVWVLDDQTQNLDGANYIGTRFKFSL
jgi:hypothetical protein